MLLTEMHTTHQNLQGLGDWLLHIWLQFDVDRKDSLNLDQVTLLLKHLNIRLSKQQVKGAFKVTSCNYRTPIWTNKMRFLSVNLNVYIVRSDSGLKSLHCSQV
jgi:hypothetical protein